jgi:phenylacetaldehyde dehydrogenase
MNDLPYGLAASLWTNELSKVMRMISRIEAETVWVNMHSLIDPALSFGGSKSSGGVSLAVRLSSTIPS